ncbi:hypothetical protein GLOIN_2v616434 [Rhizophagus irregularis DAOM 181602=DAOM 197198]|uniref:Uncharacterized protein n=1 Tax=Rhizophagus irregularis (strain DAOM 181602 / DAOM 197198 / MUCL 43194) TaxID=747089 RepID=A0A2P4QYT1_RHIID|nr:hypothetical protein GLOIN_2v616434 [Rhizophagus irregularis DAOM 181602=DAOM 197198]POG82728.1 hypothetical protein GLOIN_2v616434 [Rhizophagus irregularis DAOM 181602=DAOM 197198]|eukprot:XP_025189594.1 hypothetical protein GLOIN_2v616434 [Rhizophagus irregularis DAOM 181602=DAOM 197198]
MDISYILIFFPSIVIAQSDKEQNNDDAFIDNLFFTILPIIISIIAFTDKENDHIHYGYWVNLFHTVVSSHLLPLVLSIINEFATEDAPRAISWFTIYMIICIIIKIISRFFHYSVNKSRNPEVSLLNIHSFENLVGVKRYLFIFFDFFYPLIYQVLIHVLVMIGYFLYIDFLHFHLSFQAIFIRILIFLMTIAIFIFYFIVSNFYYAYYISTSFLFLSFIGLVMTKNSLAIKIVFICMLVFLTQSANFIKKVRKGKDGGLLWIMDHIQWFIVQLIYCNILIKCDENKLNLCDDCKRLRGDCENPSPCKILCCNCTNPCKGFQLCDDCKRKIGKAPQWVVKRIHCYISLRADLNHLKDGKIAISSHPFEAN